MGAKRWGEEVNNGGRRTESIEFTRRANSRQIRYSVDSWVGMTEDAHGRDLWTWYPPTVA